MGPFSRRRSTQTETIAETEVVTFGMRVERFEGEELVDVVGESYYQPAIRAACGAGGNEEVKFECFAELVPEPENPHDPNAVKVMIDGRQVGHLSRADAVELGPAIVAARKLEGGGLVRAMIVGHEGGDTDNLGVFLRIEINRGSDK
jgi:hypothetical protein